MVSVWHPFTGTYNDEKASFIVEGFFNVIPKAIESSSPIKNEILIVIYNVINESNKSKIFGHQQVIYILIDDSDCSIGDIVNQRPELLHHDFYETLKQIITRAYNNVQNDNQARLTAT
jgi:hypothetical protein